MEETISSPNNVNWESLWFIATRAPEIDSVRLDW